ncbi:MAG: hypothetical protein M9894_39355, partial [Planctomycetes bacterium]|nr:hypothetical protein [Planctomycetota bacterium]
MLRCAYCHGPLEASAACPGCGTRLHADCWAQAGGCPTLGCGRPAAAVGAKPGGRARVTVGLLVGVAVLAGAWLARTTTPTLDLVLERHGEDGHLAAVAFTPDGGRVVGRFDHTVSTWTLPEGALVSRFWYRERGGARSDSFVLAPDGRAVAIGRTVHALPGGEAVAHLPGDALAWRGDGVIAVVASGALAVVRLDGAPPRPLEASLHEARPWARAVFGAPDRLAVATLLRDWGEAVEVWDVGSGDRLEVHPRHHHNAGLAFAPDGALYSAGTGVGAWSGGRRSLDAAVSVGRPGQDPPAVRALLMPAPGGRTRPRGAGAACSAGRRRGARG